VVTISKLYRDMKTILITGGTGFLGSNLCKRLISNGMSMIYGGGDTRIICVDNNYTGRLLNVAELIDHPNFTFVEHDICEPLELNEKIDQIYNLACPASPPAYQGKQAIKTTKTCVFGAINMLELAKQNGATILQASTSEVYGEPLVHPQVETYRGNVNPNGIRACYDEGKRCAESLFFDYWRNEGVDIKVIRIFNTYGPNMDPNDGRVVSNFICQALSGQDITIYGDGHQTRSFCYVDDLIEAMIRMMNSPKDFTGPVNTGNPGEFTIKELAEKVIAKIGGSSKIVYKALPSDDPTQRRPDITLAKSKLGWEPKIQLDEGLDKTIAYFKTQLNLFKHVG
jgi:UDP-glucuronate decarboxylase